MAYAITNKDYSLSFISKDLEQLKLQYPGYAHYQNGLAGHLVTLSDADFILLQANEKVFSYDGTTVTLNDLQTGSNPEITHPTFSNNEIKLKNYIENIINRIDNVYNKHSNNSFGVELLAYKNLLQGFDTSSITYPFNKSIERHLLDLSHPIICTLQMV
jgi:hypothetical protein